MRRVLGVAVAVTALVGADRLGPDSLALDGGQSRHREAAVLGPLRPLVAELRLLQAELRWLDGDRFGFLHEVRTVLALRPDVPELWAEFGNRLMLDVPREVADVDEQRAWFARGYEILDEGLDRHPRSALLWVTLAQVMHVTVDVHPERWRAREESAAVHEGVFAAAREAERWADSGSVLGLQARQLQVLALGRALPTASGESVRLLLTEAEALLQRVAWDPELSAQLEKVMASAGSSLESDRAER